MSRRRHTWGAWRAGLFCALAACRSPGLSATDPPTSAGDFRSAPLSVAALGCSPPATANLNAYELSWARAENRLTVDLYSASGFGCADLLGGALIDRVANILFLFFDAARCSNACGPVNSHVRLVLSDDLHELTSDPTITITTGTGHPDFANTFRSGIPLRLESSYAEYIPTVSQALVAPVSPGRSRLTVWYATAACQANFVAVGSADGAFVVPLASQPSETFSCVAGPEGDYFFDTVLTQNGSEPPVHVLSHAQDGTFSLIQASR